LELGEEDFVDSASEVNADHTPAYWAFWYFSVRVFAFEVSNIFNDACNGFS
jgi:hypothetical protein